MGMTVASYGSNDILMSLHQNGIGAYYHLYSSGTTITSYSAVNSGSTYERVSSVAIDNNTAIVVGVDSSFVVRAYLIKYNSGVAPTILYTLTIGTFTNLDTLSVQLLANQNVCVHFKQTAQTVSNLYTFKYSSTSLSGLTNLGNLFTSQTGTAFNYQSNKNIVVYPTNLVIGTLTYSSSALGYRAVQLTGVNYDGLIGLSQTTASSGDKSTVALLGSVSSCHSGLLTGQKYYLQTDGSISNVKTPYFLGVAISSTQILLKGYGSTY
jgi:hypothetical protein